MQLFIRHGSLTDGSEDVLVNASNTLCRLGSGVSAAISRACGPTFQAEVDQQRRTLFGDTLEPGDVLITSAGLHPRATWVAHVAVLDYRPGTDHDAFPDQHRIEAASLNLWRAMELLEKDSISIAMVALGAGTGQLPVAVSVDASCRALRAHLAATNSSRIQHLVYYAWSNDDFRSMSTSIRCHFPDLQVAT